jgi:hypothetical protein
LKKFYLNVIKDIGILVRFIDIFLFIILFIILDKPIKGQAYRSLEFNKENNFCDPVVAQVCHHLGFTPDLLGIRHELTLWIDPYEISIRYALS